MINLTEEKLRLLLISAHTLEALENGDVDNWEWCGECTNKSCAKCPSKDVKEGFYVAGQSGSNSGSRN